MIDEFKLSPTLSASLHTKSDVGRNCCCARSRITIFVNYKNLPYLYFDSRF